MKFRGRNVILMFMRKVLFVVLFFLESIVESFRFFWKVFYVLSICLLCDFIILVLVDWVKVGCLI